jgi:hypothetical protein
MQVIFLHEAEWLKFFRVYKPVWEFRTFNIEETRCQARGSLTGIYVLSAPLCHIARDLESSQQNL